MNTQMSLIRLERSFGLVVGGVVASLGGWLLLQEKFGKSAPLLLALGILLIVFAVVHPKALSIPARLWAGVAEILSFISTRLILAFIFFLVITPIGFVKRLLGWDPLQRHFSSLSYWAHYSARQKDVRHYEKMF